MKTILKYKKKKISFETHKCNWFEKIIGLMFSKKEDAKTLIFEFETSSKRAIHSFFVFFPFLAIWRNSRRQIIKIQVIKPWKFSVKPRKNFKELIEIPINKKNSKVVKFLVGNAKDL